VRFFRVENKDGSLVAQFYLDLYAREGKRRRRLDGRRPLTPQAARRRVQTPVAYLNCNFSAPVGGQPALLHARRSHHAVPRVRPRVCTTCSRSVEELGVSGINGVEWDAVELPSQFMENFCWEWDVLHVMTEHVDTGAPLPRELFDKMLAAKNFQSGLQHIASDRTSRCSTCVCTSRTPRIHDATNPIDGGAAIDALSGGQRVRCGRDFAREINEHYHVVPQAPFLALAQYVHAYLRGRVRGGVLQLQVGRSAVGRCVRGFRRSREARRTVQCSMQTTGIALSSRDSRGGRKPARNGLFQGLPWP
jgi:oligopeptidase A